MPISVDWVSQIISVPKSDLTLISGQLYSHDTEVLRQELLAAQASEEGMTHSDIHGHNAEYVVFGETYAQKLEILPGWSIQYLGGPYSVKFTGSNNNLADVDNGIFIVNDVIPISTNSAGLIVKAIGSGVTLQDITDIATKVWSVDQDNHKTPGSTGENQSNIALVRALVSALL